MFGPQVSELGPTNTANHWEVTESMVSAFTQGTMVSFQQTQMKNQATVVMSNLTETIQALQDLNGQSVGPGVVLQVDCPTLGTIGKKFTKSSIVSSRYGGRWSMPCSATPTVAPSP